MRIFRTILLLTGVTTFMPSPPENSTSQTVASNADQAAPGLMASATLAIADAAGFCSRQPEVCQTAGYVAGKLEAKAKYSVRLIYEWAAESSSGPQVSPIPNQADQTDPLVTGSTRMAAAEVPPAGQSTLRIEDLIPEWRGPVGPKKKG